jgi:hypothetical protein
MNRLASLVTAAAALLVCALPFGTPRAAGEEKGRADEKAKDQKAVKLDALDENTGATFGDWTVWRYGAKATVLRNTKTEYVIYLPWTSNGWLNYRTDKKEWFVSYSFGKPMTQDRSDLKVDDMFKKAPTVALEPGKYTVQGEITINGMKMTQKWDVTVGKDTIEFANTDGKNKLVITKTSAEFTHNDRAIGGK